MKIATIIPVILTVLIVGLFYYWQRLKNYWKRRNVPTIAENAFHGIYKDTMSLKQTLNETYRKVYEENKDLKFYGTFFFGRPTLVIHDPEIIKNVLVKDFQNFSSHGFYVNTDKDPLSGHLFALDGPKWKSTRSKLTVTFTSGKIKYMFDKIQETVQHFTNVIDRELEKTGNVVDMKDKLACLSTDLIASVAFGIDVNSLENPKIEFREIGRVIFKPTTREFIRHMSVMNAHWLLKVFNMNVVNPRANAFVMEMVKNTVEYREKNDVVRNDFMNMMIQLKNKGYVEGDSKDAPGSTEQANISPGGQGSITFNELAAQVFVFYVAGFETTSSLATFVLYELSIHPEIQRKVQEECDETLRKSGGHVTYEAVQSMTYTEQVLYETLRIFPAMAMLIRSTSKDCTLPLTDVKLEKDTPIAIPIQGLHMDPRYFPDPDKFDPERFTEEAKASRPPYVFMPFGEGPRLCIGMRFALVQVKSVVLSLFSRYNFELATDIPVPIKLDPKGLTTTPVKIDFVISRRQ